MKRPRNPATGARSELTFTQAYRAGCRRGESRKLRQHWEPHTRSAEQTMSVRKLSPHTPVGTPSLTCMLAHCSTRKPTSINIYCNSEFGSLTIPKRPHNKCKVTSVISDSACMHSHSRVPGPGLGNSPPARGIHAKGAGAPGGYCRGRGRAYNIRIRTRIYICTDRCHV